MRKKNNYISFKIENDTKQSLISDFSPDNIDAIKPFCNTVYLKKDTILLHAGDLPTHCYYVKSGVMTAAEISESGTEHFYNFNHFNFKDTLLFDANILMKRPLRVSFMALTDAELLKIDFNQLYRLAQTHPDVFHFLNHSLAKKFVAASDELHNYSLESLEWRYCNLLINLAKNEGEQTPGGLTVKNVMTLSQLSKYLGISRTKLFIITKPLKEQGLIRTGRKKIIIPSLEKLMAYRRSIEMNGF